jgi:hypothetical protein
VFALFDALLPMLSLGVAIAGAERTDAGSTTSQINEYESFAQSYVSLPWNGFYIRPGVRLGFGHQNADGPQNPIRIFETTYKAGAEFALIFSGIVIPSVSLQGFILNRTLKLSRPDNVSNTANLMNRTEWLNARAITLGLGIPIADGRVIVEPFYRFVHIYGDERQDHLVGLDLSVSLNFHAPEPL